MTTTRTPADLAELRRDHDIDRAASAARDAAAATWASSTQVRDVAAAMSRTWRNVLAAMSAGTAAIGALLTPLALEALVLGFGCAVVVAVIAVVTTRSMRDGFARAVSVELARCDEVDPTGVIAERLLGLVAANPSGWTQWNVDALGDAVRDLHAAVGADDARCAISRCLSDAGRLDTIVWLDALVDVLDTYPASERGARIVELVDAGATYDELVELAARRSVATAQRS